MPKKKFTTILLILTGIFLLLGSLVWVDFLNSGRIPPYQDWVEITFPRLALMQNAFSDGQFPWHSATTGNLRGITDRIFSIPDMMTFPDLILLKWLSIPAFIIVHWLLCYFLGLAGITYWAIKKDLHPVLFFVIWLLFTFNGHITGHLSIGHFTWGGYFLIPWVILLSDNISFFPNRWLWVIITSLTTLAIWMLGSFQQFTLFILIFFMLGIMNRIHRWWYWAAGLASLLLSSFRILPSTLILGSADNQPLGGFPRILYGIQSVINPVEAQNWHPFSNFYSPLGWWEFNHYLGIAGALILFLLAGGWVWEQWKTRKTSPWLIIAIVLSLSSIGMTYSQTIGQLPMWNGMRVTSRILIIPILIVLFTSSSPFQRVLGTMHRSIRWLVYTALSAIGLFIGWDYFRWVNNWKISEMSQQFETLPFSAAAQRVANHPDPLYFATVIVGALIFIATLSFLAIKAKRHNDTAYRP